MLSIVIIMEDFKQLVEEKNKKYSGIFLSLYQKFWKLNNGSEQMNMINCLNEMKIMHGKMLTKLHKLMTNAGEINENANPSELNMHYYNISSCSCLNDHMKKMINECEDTLQNKIINNDGHNVHSDERNTEAILKNKETRKKTINNIHLDERGTEDILNEKEIRKKHNANKQKETTPRVILFYATWCGPSQKLLPTWNSVKEKNYNGKVKFITIDCGGGTENDKAIIDKHNVTHFPLVRVCTVYNGEKHVSEYNIQDSSSINDLIKWIRDETGCLPVLQKHKQNIS